MTLPLFIDEAWNYINALIVLNTCIERTNSLQELDFIQLTCKNS